MRILWLSHLVPYPPKGGVQQRSYNLLRELSRYHDVDFLAFNQRALVPEDQLGESIRALGEFCNVLNVVPIPGDTKLGKRLLAVRSVLTGYPYTLGWLQSNRFRELVRLHSEQTKYDFVHFDTISLAPYIEELRCENARSSLTHHNVESDMLRRRASVEENRVLAAYFGHEARRLHIYESRIASRFAVHLTCSELDRDRLQAIAGDVRVEVVPNGVDTTYFEPKRYKLPKKTGSLVFAGGLAWYPNASAIRFFLDEVWPLLIAERSDVTMTIVGRAPPKWLIDRARHDSRLSVTGFVQDVRPYLASSEVYVCPIFDGGGTKLKVLDALAMGLPLIAHPVACEGIDVEPGRHVLLAVKPQDFVASIGRALDDAILRENLATEGRRLVEARYDFNQIGRRLASLYEQLVGT